MALVPGVSRSVWRENDPASAVADQEYRAKRPSALARHNYTCLGCRVKSKDGMEIHHQDCNHANNSDENLGAECVFCHPVNHIGELASRFTRMDTSEVVAGSEVELSYLPGISQSDLSHLFRTIGHVMANGNEVQKSEAANLYQHLLSYSDYIKGIWGTSDPGYFAIALRECSEPTYQLRTESMKGIRVIFSLESIRILASKFGQEFKALPIDSWVSIAKQRMSGLR